MLYNLDWLKSGELFPPRSEIPRLKGYADNRNLFMDRSELVLKPYLDRLRSIVDGMKEYDHVNYSFLDIPNYWQLSTIKTTDLAVGDKPTIKVQNKDIAQLDDIDLYGRLVELVQDIDSLGDSVVRCYLNNKGEKDFVIMSPANWFPIVNTENVKEIKQHVLAWTMCTYQDVKHPNNNKYELHVQIHTPGSTRYLEQIYKVKGHEYKSFIDGFNENCGQVHFFEIGKLLSETEKDSGYENAIIHFSGMSVSDSPYGISNYDRITSVVAEIAVRKALGNFILDMNSAPLLALPSTCMVKNKDGYWTYKGSGRRIAVEPNGMTPIYVTWDGNLDSNERAIERLYKELYSLSEMGTILNNDEVNSSQGYEALQIKMTNAKLKVRRLCTKISKPLKRLIANILGVEEKEVFILFNEGIPVTEGQNIQNAIAKKSVGFSTKSTMMEYFGLTEKDADKEIEQAQSESPSPFASSFGGQQNQLF